MYDDIYIYHKSVRSRCVGRVTVVVVGVRKHELMFWVYVVGRKKKDFETKQILLNRVLDERYTRYAMRSLGERACLSLYISTVLGAGDALNSNG